MCEDCGRYQCRRAHADGSGGWLRHGEVLQPLQAPTETSRPSLTEVEGAAGFRRLILSTAARYQQSGHDTPDGAAALVWPWMYCCETIDEDRGGPTAVLWIVMGVVRRYSCC